MVVAYDMHRSLTYANKAAEKLIGYGHAELQVADPLSWTHPEDRSQVRALWDKAFDGQTIDQVVYRVITKDGTTKWAAGSWGPVVDEKGHQVGVRGTCLDITERMVAEQALQETTQKFRTIVEEIAERKRAEEALRENEQRLVSIYNTVRDVIFHLTVEPDGQFRFVSVNAAFLSVTGLSLERVVGKTVNEVIPEPSLTMVLGKYRQAVEEKTIVFWEETSDYPTGRLTGEVSVAPVFDNKGTCTHLVGSVHDITERKRAEALVRESEERFRFAQKVAGIGTFDWNIETGVNTWTPELEAMYGLPPGGFEGTRPAWEALVHPDDRARAMQRVKESFETNTPVEEEWRVTRPDGSVRWIAGRWQVVKDDSGKPLRVMGVNIDVTNRKQMEEVLRHSEERFRLAIRATNDAIWDIDLKTRTVSWNETYSTLYGRPPETSESWQWWIDRIHPEDRERTDEGLRRAISSGASSWTSEYRFQRADGDWAYIYDRAYIARDGAGAAWRVIGAMQDLTERKRAEEALRESDERFRATFFQAAVGIAQTGLDGKWLLVNDRLCELLGYTQAELRGKTFLDITHPDDREASLGAIRRILAGEISSWSTEKRYVRKDGTIVWGRLWVSLVRDMDNLPRYFTSVVEDVTERIQADRALRDSEQRLMLAQSAAHLGIWERDLRTNVKTISGEYAKLYGLPPDRSALMYEEWLSLTHPDDRDRLQTHIRESIERTGSWDTEFRVVWPDGSVHWLLTKGTVLLDDSGQPQRRVGVNLDITERKQADEVRSHLAAIVESSDDAIMGETLDGTILSWNPGAERMYGYKAREIVGKPVSLLVPPGRPNEIPQILERLRHGERLEHFETTRVREDGRRIEVSVSISPISDRTGAVVGASVITRDITDQKRAEATLRQSLDEIAHLNRVAAMGELTASIAHELNQPLAAILCNAQAAGRFLNRESPDLARVQECLNAIAADDGRAADVIKRLRSLLKKGEFQPSSVDLNEVVSDAIRLVSSDAALRQVSVKFEPLRGLPPVLGDRIQLYQVVLNLIMNGLDAAAERLPVERWVLVRTAEADGGGVELTVEDSGKGIAESDLARVFEPFFTTKREGLGMGLSISQSIVQAHGGQIWAENSAGGGAIFRFSLPVAQQAAAASTK
jgi:PAS domain S-box-containing protein